MLRLRGIVAERGYVKPYWGAQRDDPRRPYRVPEHLRGPRQHRRAVAAGCWRGHELEVQAIEWAMRSSRATISCTSAAGRTASRRWWQRTSRERRGASGGSSGRSGGARGLRRLPAHRALLPRPLGRRAARCGVLPLHTVAARPDDRRRPARVRARARRPPDDRRVREPRGRTILEDGAEPLGRVVAGFGNDGESGFEGCRAGRVVGTYLHGPLLPRNPWLADWLLARDNEPASRGAEPLTDTLEDEAHRVAAARARSRGGGAPGSPTSPPQSYGRWARCGLRERAERAPTCHGTHNGPRYTTGSPDASASGSAGSVDGARLPPAR